MPTYAYECTECELIFEVFHPMSETVETCKACQKPVRRRVSPNFNIKKTRVSGKNKSGRLVKQYIEDVKEEVKREKEKLSTQEYSTK